VLIEIYLKFDSFRTADTICDVIARNEPSLFAHLLKLYTVKQCAV